MTSTDPGNWTNTTGTNLPPPNIGDEVEFNGSHTVTFTYDEAADKRLHLGGDVTFLADNASGQTFNVTTDALVRDGATFNIGSALNPMFITVGDEMPIGTSTGHGTVVVSGVGSRLDVLGAVDQSTGSSGFEGELTVTDDATANYAINGTLRLGISSNSMSEGTVTVNGGATLNAGHIDIATDDSEATATMTVTGSDSSINQTLADANLTIGSASVAGRGTLKVGTNGTFITNTGTIDIQGGTFMANGNLLLADSASTLRINGGSLTATSGLDNSANGTIEFDDGTLTLDGGTSTLTSNAFFLRGPIMAGKNPTLEVTGGAAITAGSVTLETESTLIISGGGEFSTSNVIISQIATSNTNNSATVSGTDGSGNPSKLISTNIFWVSG